MITCEMILTQTSFIWTLVQTDHVIILTVIFINFKLLIIQCFLILSFSTYFKFFWFFRLIDGTTDSLHPF